MFNIFNKRVAPQDRVLDWQSHHDPRSLEFPVRALMAETVAKKKTMWKTGIVLDQGTEGACVGFGWTGELLAAPASPKIQPRVKVADSFARSVYHEAQKIDEWDGESYKGTSVLAGAKIIQQKGFITNYRWAFGIDDIRDSVITQGPVVLGVPWYKDMYYTDERGLVSITGDSVGGHCITITGYDPAMKFGSEVFEVFRWRNSWGKKYGINGDGYIKLNDLSTLIAQGGEACVPVGRKIPVIK